MSARENPSAWKDMLVRAWHLRSWKRSHHLVTNPISAWRFLLADREVTNFTYAISNAHELPTFLARHLGISEAAASRHLAELEGDKELVAWLRGRRAAAKRLDRGIRFGRRVGWYLLVRELKPKIAIETGTHDGLGTALMARALQRNTAEGHPGKLLTVDIDPTTGWLLPPPLEPFVERVVGEGATVLAKRVANLDRVDFFLHDSDHSYEHEMKEIKTVWPKLSAQGVLASDNFGIYALKDFSRDHGLHFGFWRERPRGHPYPGSGLGVARHKADSAGPRN